LTSFTSNIQKLEVSGTTSTWTQIYSAIGADAPTARDHHTMTHFVDGFTVVFGGSDGTFRNDVWEMELSGMHAVWNHLTNAGTIPSVRAGHTMTALSDNTGVMFGGYNYDNYLNDVFQLQRSGDTATWMQLTDAGNPPSGRSVHAMTGLADGTFVIFGGYDGADFLNDIYMLEVSATTATWTQFTNAGDVPSDRHALGMHLAWWSLVMAPSSCSAALMARALSTMSTNWSCRRRWCPRRCCPPRQCRRIRLLLRCRLRLQLRYRRLRLQLRYRR